MAQRKKIVKTTLPPNTGTLNAAIDVDDGLFVNVNEEASYRVTKRMAQNKLEAHADWQDGMNQFRERAMSGIEKIELIEGYTRRNIELLMKKVLALEKKVEQLSSKRPL